MEHSGEVRARSAVWRENLGQAMTVVRTHRMRSGLLVLGVAIGIMTILMMVTVLTGLARKINHDMVSANRPYLWAQKMDMIVTGEEEERQMRRRELTRADAEALAESCPSLDRVSFTVQAQASPVVRYRSRRTPPTGMVGSAASFPDLFSIELAQGRFFTALEERHRERVIVLGYGPAKDLFPHENPIGKYVHLEGRPYKVVGAFATRHHLAGRFSDNFVVVPHTTFAKDMERPEDFVSIYANVREGRTLAQGQEEMVATLRVRRGLRPGKDNDFAVGSSESFLDLVRRVTVPIGLVLTVIASIGLVVGGIGVMNIMLISVAERTREIGVRMAVGASRRDVLQQFLVESATLTGIGGIVGTLLGTLLAWLVSRTIHFPFAFSIFWTVVALLFSGLVGVIFGLYPARRAAGMDPVDALRYE